MDKFGIFNLLNTFLSNNTTTPPDSEPDKNNTNNLLNTILNSLKTNTTSTSTQNVGEKTTVQKPTPASIKPLQQSMLSTMSSHDLLIKRVKEKSPTLPK